MLCLEVEPVTGVDMGLRPACAGTQTGAPQRIKIRSARSSVDRRSIFKGIATEKCAECRPIRCIHKSRATLLGAATLALPM